MMEACRYLGDNGSDEHTVLVITKRSIFSFAVILGLKPVTHVEIFVGRVGEEATPFMSVSTGSPATEGRQHMITEFLKERLHVTPR